MGEIVGKVSIADGIIDVYEYFDDEKFRLPADITELSPNDLRACHAYWGENYVYCMNKVGFIQASIKDVEAKRSKRYRNRFIFYKQRRLANDFAKAMAEETKSVQKYDERLRIYRLHESRWVTLMQSCDTFKAICSRDQSYREKELDHYNRRGGQGK